MKEFGDELTKLGVECKLVLDTDYYDGFPSRKLSHWFQSTKKFDKLIRDFKPDAVFIDRLRHFGLAAIKSNIPLFVHLRGKKLFTNHYTKKLRLNNGKKLEINVLTIHH